MTEYASGFESVQYDNGLRLSVCRLPAKSAYGRLRVKQGSLHETRSELGHMHFMEHALMLGGTRKYTPRKQRFRLNRFSPINAYTMLDAMDFEGGFLPY